MPKASISIEPKRFDLKSAPPDGFVTLKRMTYGDWLARRDMAMLMGFSGDVNEMGGTMELQNKKVTLFEFAKCVVDHNLTGEDGAPLNFGTASIMEVLDPKVGNEIGQLINDMHDFEGDLKN
jgi:hypothetical protein